MTEVSNLIPLNAIKVALKEGQEARKSLIKNNLFLKDFHIIRDENYVYFPIKDDYYKYSSIKWEIIKKKFIAKEKKETLQEKLEEIIPFEYHQFIPSSYDRIGDIILIKLPFELIDFKSKIGNLIKEKFSISSVFMKTGMTSSIYRITKWSIISGDDNPVTIHKMNNLRFSVNINEVYFNPRLSLEYKRITEICEDNWVIIDMFAGIGPFSINVAASKHVNVYGCDINPKSIIYFKQNIDLNRKLLKGKVLVFQGDISEQINSFPKANLIFMNLPENAIDYLEVAILYLKPNGIIILHQFLVFKDKSNLGGINKYKAELEEKLFYYDKINGLHLTSFKVTYRVLREVSPSKSHIIWEIRAL